MLEGALFGVDDLGIIAKGANFRKLVDDGILARGLNELSVLRTIKNNSRLIFEEGKEMWTAYILPTGS